MTASSFLSRSWRHERLSAASRTGLLIGAGATACMVSGISAAAVPAYGGTLGLGADGVALLCLAGAGWSLRDLMAKIDRAASVCMAAARGDLEARILEEPDRGVVGHLQHGINGLLDVADAFVREAQGSMHYASEKKFFRKVLLRGLPASFQNAARVINGAVEMMETNTHEFSTFAKVSVGGVARSVADAMTEMRASAEALARTATDSDSRAGAAANATRSASENVQRVASAAEELSASIAEIGRQVEQSSGIAAAAVAEAEGMNMKVKSLVDAAETVTKIVHLINDIAGQTNLLALNATIEAARAGEAGKGFAVVANEVKELAGQTAKATEEITAQVAAIQAATGEAAGAIQNIGQTIGDIDKVTAAIAAAIEQQSAATEEIARNIQAAAAGTEEVLQNIVGVTEAAGATDAASRQMVSAALDISGQAERLNAEIEIFAEKARAA